MRRAITALTATTFTAIAVVAIGAPANAADLTLPDGTVSFEKTVSLDGGATWSDPTSSTPTIAAGGDELLWRLRFAPTDPASAFIELDDLVVCDVLPTPLTLSGEVTAIPADAGGSEIEVGSIEYGVDADCAGTTGWTTTWSPGANSVRIVYDEVELEDDIAQELPIVLPVTLAADIAPGDYSNTASATLDDATITGSTNASVVRVLAPAPPALPPAPAAAPAAQEQLSATGADLTSIWPAIPLLGIGMILLFLRRRRNTASER